MKFDFVRPWHAFLPVEPGHVVAVAGSGGKTSLMLSLAATYAEQQVPVLLTTTTRTEPLELPVRDLNSLSAPDDGSSLPPAFFLRGGLDADGKWLGLAAAQVDELVERLPDRVVLVEADGAAKLPLKLHREDEPVWPGRTSLAMLVMGVHAVGETAGRVVHRLGRVSAPAVAGMASSTVWEWDHTYDLLVGTDGYLARVPVALPVVLALTGLDDQPDSIGLFDFVGRVMADPRLPLVMLCSLDAGQRTIRTAYRPEAGNHGE